MIPRFACCLLLVFGCLSTCGLYGAEGPEKPDPDRFGSPLLRVWHPVTLSGDHMDFKTSLRREMNSGVDGDGNTDDLIEEPEQLTLVKRHGILIYHDPDRRKFLLTHEYSERSYPGYPWLKLVGFMKVGSRARYEEEVRNQTILETELLQMTLAKEGDVFRLKNKEPEQHFWVGPIPHGVRSIPQFQPDHDLFSFFEKSSRYWTYRDGYMFFGDFEEILEMDFPSPRELEPKGNDADRDVFVQVDLNAVLPRQKRILWELIRKEFERSLQQYDEEGDAEYAFRKSVGDLQLNLIQAVTQDLESIKIGIDFASEEKPAKAELELVARPRVNLEHYFGTSGIGTPALAAFVEEPAAMTLATSWGLPERIVQTLEKLQLVVDAKLAEQRGWTVDAILASEELTQDLLETIHGNNQLVIKLKQSEQGFTLYGGMRIQNAGRVSKNLALVLQGLTARDGWGVLQSRDDSGRQYFSFRPAELTEGVAKHQRESYPSELHFTVVDEILWFSVGRQDSLDILSASLDRIEENETQPVKSSIPLALFDLSLDGMFPEKDLNDTEGFDRLPLAMVEKLDSLIPRRGNSSSRDWGVTVYSSTSHINVSDNLIVYGLPESKESARAAVRWSATPQKKMNTEKLRVFTEEDLKLVSPSADFADRLTLGIKSQVPDPMKMQKFLQPDQSRIRIQLDADEKRVRARATVGLGVIKHIYSRMMETENTRFQRLSIELGDVLLESNTIELNSTLPQVPQLWM